MVNHKTYSQQPSSDSESDSSTILPFPIQEFVMEPGVPMSMNPLDTASLTAMPEGWTPQVIPTNTDWRRDPRWQSLRGDVTPKQVHIPEDTLVPDPSPTKSVFSHDGESDGGSNPATPTGSFIHRRRRRGEYHHRPPVWILQPSLAPDNSHQVSQHERGRDFSSFSGGSRAINNPFGPNFGQLAYNNQLTTMASNIDDDPFFVGSMQDTNDGDRNKTKTTHQLPMPMAQSQFEVSQFSSSDSSSVTSAEYSCVPSATPCHKCSEFLVCEHCGRCETCLGETSRCPNWRQSKHRQLVGNENKGEHSKPKDSKGKKAVRSLPLTDSMPKTYVGPSLPLRTSSNMATKGETPRLSIRTTDFDDTDTITPASPHRPSKDMLDIEGMMRIGEVVTKLPKKLSDEVNNLIRKTMPEAKSHYNTAMDVAGLPEEILVSLREWLAIPASPVYNTHRSMQSCSSDANDIYSPTPDENGPRCLARCRDIRVRRGSYAIEAGSQVICVGRTEVPAPDESEFELQKGQVFTVVQVFGDYWAACIKGTLQGAFEDEEIVRLVTIYGERYCVVKKNNANLGFLPLCAVTLISNYADFLVNDAESEKKPWSGLTVSAPKRVQSLKAQVDWANFMEVTVPHSHWTMHKASATMNDVTKESEPFAEGVDERKSDPCLYYQRDADCDKESFGGSTTLTRKAAKHFQKAKVLLGREDERDAVEKKLKRLPLHVATSGEEVLSGVSNPGLGGLPSLRDSQIGTISQSEQPPADNMLLRDAGNLLSNDPGARYRDAEGPHWWMTDPRPMSMDEPRARHAVETESWGREFGKKMAATVSSGGQSFGRSLRRIASFRPRGSSQVRPTVVTPELRTPLSPSTIPQLWRRTLSPMAGRGAARTTARSPVSDRSGWGDLQDGLEDEESTLGEYVSGASQ